MKMVVCRKFRVRVAVFDWLLLEKSSFLSFEEADLQWVYMKV